MYQSIYKPKTSLLFYLIGLLIPLNLSAETVDIEANLQRQLVNNKAQQSLLTADTSANAADNDAATVTSNGADEINTAAHIRYFDIEVILFMHNDDQAVSSEFWEPADQEMIAAINSSFSKPLAAYSIRANRFNAIENTVSALTKPQLKLHQLAQHIRYSKQYRMLTHFGWRQPGLSDAEARSVSFPMSNGSEPVFGEIKIVLSRFLHSKVYLNRIMEICRPANQQPDENPIKVEVQIDDNDAENDNSAESAPAKTADMAANSSNAAAEPLTAAGLVSAAHMDTPKQQLSYHCQEEIIKFKQSRKMRSKELHYLDHPVFGLLIQIDPVQPNQ